MFEGILFNLLWGSHIPGGQMSLIYSLRLIHLPPWNGQDCSRVVASQPSPLRSDPFGALGLTELQLTARDLLDITPALWGFATFFMFFTLTCVLRCRQTHTVIANLVHRKRPAKDIVMLARFEEYVPEDLIGGNLEDKVEILREHLEKTFCHD